MKNVLARFSVLFSLLSFADGHAYLVEPKSRNLLSQLGLQGAQIEDCPHCMNGGGGGRVTDRQATGVSEATMASFGLQAKDFPLNRLIDLGHVSSIGTVLEPDSIAARHGVCGDPGQNRYDL